MSEVSILLCWWHLGIVIGSAIALYTNSARAQITPDTTLPNNSSVRLDGNTLVISGGTTRGSNMFHSFSEFSVHTGKTALFNNALEIQNIISRVTGKSVSNIDGLIKANDRANLFLINPNGIIFGKDASLNIGGSFVATTANAIGFGQSGFFSASNPEAPSPLLTVNPNALLFNQIAASQIQNSSISGLRVPNSRSLLLVGGDIKMDGGKLNAFGGLVELGGLSSVGTIGLNANGNNLSLSFPNNVEKSDVFLSNGAQVNVIASDGGSIAVKARNLEMTGESFLFAGIESGNSSDNSKAGNISVNATVAINLNNKSQIANQVLAQARGQAGDVNISASTLRVEGGARVNVRTLGAGKGGNLRVDTQDVQLIGTSADGQVGSGLFAQANPNSTGDAGDLTIKTNTLLVRDGAQVNTSTFGAGKGGNLSVDAQDVQLIDISPNRQFTSGLGTSAAQNSKGDAGDLTIKTNTLLVRDGAQVNTSTYGAGKGGNLSVDAQDVQLISESANGEAGSGLFASAQANSKGDGGNLTVRTNTLLVRDGAQVFTGTFGEGKGGNLSVDAQDMQLIGTSANGPFRSGLLASAQRNSKGDAGDLMVRTNTLLVRDGAEISAGTSGTGKGGNLSVDAQDVQLIGESADSKVPSALFASTTRNSTGDAGDLTIKTNSLLVRDGAQISAGTFGAGKGGSLSVDATDVQIIGISADGRSGSGLFASAAQNSTGDAGDLTVKTNTLLVRDRAEVTVQSIGTGTAGNMTLNAHSIRLNNNASVSANTRSAKVDPNREQATININSQDLIMTGNSNIRTDARGANVIGGNINIDTDTLAVFENSLISANSTDSRGGRVTINTQGIFPAAFRNYITATGATPDLSGTLQINTPDVDPSKGLVPLTIDVVDVVRLVDDNICAKTADSSFTYIGRGGLPPSPNNALNSNAMWEDWRLTAVTRQTQRDSESRKETNSSEPTQIVEAQSWIINQNGEVILTAETTTATPSKVGSLSSECQAKITK